MALWECYRVLPPTHGEWPKVTYAELVTIILTGLTVAFALFAAIAGVLAFWGYSNIKREAASAANAAVEAAIKSALDKHLNEAEMGATIKKELKIMLTEEIRSVRSEVRAQVKTDFAMLYAEAFPQSSDAERPARESASSRIADQFPGDMPK